ncbi:hypothetical protein CsSME_00026085 [Camellia sinensis var. sinensis]
MIIDVVVMYDHSTQRPRGFGFITYDSEDAVDRVLHKTFHELNTKMVEVKRAVPKELSPGPNRSPLIGYNYGFCRANSFVNSYAQGYNPSSIGGHGVRIDDRYNPVGSSRSAFSPFGPLGYGMGVNLDPGLSLSVGGGSNFSNNLGYGQVLSPYYSGNSNGYNSTPGYGGANVRNDSILSPSTRNVWGNSGISINAANAGSHSTYLGSRGGSFGVFGNSGANWGSPLSLQGGGSGVIGYSVGQNYGLRVGGFGRNSGTSMSATSLFTASNGGYEGSYGDLYRSGSAYADPNWYSASSEMGDGFGSFGYRLGNATDVTAEGSEGYIGSHSIANSQANRGIAA